MTDTPLPTAAGPSGRPAVPCEHPQQVLVVLLLGCVSFALAQTLVIPALPVIARDQDASQSATS